MQTELAIITGMLFAAGIYMILRRSMVKLIIGLMLLSHAVNLLIFTSAGVKTAFPPLVDAGKTLPPEPYADPLPQALILTAIVISFGVTAFAAVLFQRAFGALGTGDLDDMRSTDITG